MGSGSSHRTICLPATGSDSRVDWRSVRRVFVRVEPLHHVEVCSGLLRALQVLQAGGCLVSLALLGPEVRAQLPWLLAEERRLRVAGMVELST